MTTVRIVLTIAISKGWSLQLMDVKNALLYNDLKEEIYDIVITGTDSELISQLQNRLKDSFHMNDLADTPLEVNVTYRREESDHLFYPSLYRQFVSSLNYLTITRLDISFAIQQGCLFMHAPRHLHLAMVPRIICYLLGTPDRGWCMFLGSALIPWHSKKQDRVSKSFTESKYRSLPALILFGFEICYQSLAAFNLTLHHFMLTILHQFEGDVNKIMKIMDEDYGLIYYHI
ncbi:uncharacterized protein LOC111404710 [Olea europaea var. sylvestris]|uniref:uncharacterized protein LOC111404710 n=1 Tax=Olea europaea var. sylvestris TaxID=158386 RepID=UPI000C1D5F65|nr:uncharacterized protein LOC111404710 [Olea europaea var. sylvestris]